MKKILLLLILSLSFGVVGCGSDETEEDPVPVEEEKPEEDVTNEETEEDETQDEEVETSESEETDEEEQDITTYKPGTYIVGDDMPAGEYKIFTDSMGYVEVSKDSSGEMDSIITNDNFSTFIYLTIEDGQYLKLQMSEAIPADEAPAYDADDGYGSGMYKVGVDIPSGEYNIISDNDDTMAYIEVSKDSTGSMESIVTNDNFEGNKYVTVEEGQYLTLQMGHIEE